MALGAFAFSVGENSKALPGVTGLLGKRQTPSGGHTSSSGIPNKRQRVELKLPPMMVIEGLMRKDVWFNQGDVKGIGIVTATSTRGPELIGTDGDGYKVYSTGNPLGGASQVRIKNGSGWYQSQDIIFTLD